MLVIGALLLGLSGITSAQAETVSSLKPAPLPKTSAAPSMPKQTVTAEPQNPISGLATGLRALFNVDKQPQGSLPSTTTSAFTPAQRARIDKVSAYLASMHQMHGHFVQIAPDRSRSEGKFYLLKPGRVRFEYGPPSSIEIIADGRSMVIRDGKLATQDVYPLSQTPLRFLLSDRIDLLHETNVVAVRADESNVTVVIEETQPLMGTSRLMMLLGAKDYHLEQWTVTDPQGYDTTVAISNVDSSRRPDPGLFRIDYTRYAQ